MSSKLASRLRSIPTNYNLQHFILKAEVLKLYRSTLRLSRKCDATQQEEIRLYARNDIEIVKHITDESHIRQLLVEGKRKYQQLELQLAMIR